LLGSLQNYLSTEADRARCLKRGGKVEFVPLEMQAAEDRYRLEPADQLSAEKIFEARWALILLEHALTVLGRQYAVRGKEAVFETLKSFVGIGASGPEASYEAAGQRLGMGVGTVKTLIHRLRKQYMAEDTLEAPLGRRVPRWRSLRDLLTSSLTTRPSRSIVFLGGAYNATAQDTANVLLGGYDNGNTGNHSVVLGGTYISNSNNNSLVPLPTTN
jgi:hypothetical protein